MGSATPRSLLPQNQAAENEMINYSYSLQDPVLEFMRKLAIGFTSGVLGSCINIPFDVAKSRIQGPQPQQGIIKYRSTTGALQLVYKEEG